MRYLFFVGLLANILFFLWETSASPQRRLKIPEPVLLPEEPQIVLLREKTERQARDFTGKGLCDSVSAFDGGQSPLYWFDAYANDAYANDAMNRVWSCWKN